MRRRYLAPLVIATLCLSAGHAMAGPLELFGSGSWTGILEAHAGRPLVVLFWGLECASCRKAMPRWGQLLETRPDAPIVTIDADLVPDAIEDAQKFLEQSGLGNAENWIFVDRSDEHLRDEIDPHWQGEIPLTLLIGRDGTRTTIEGAAPASVVLDWLDAQSSEAK